MAWRKSPPELIALFESVVPHRMGIVQKPMFGYPACFVNGHMFMGLHQEDLILRLSEEDRKEALAAAGSKVFEPMPGRPMKEYVAMGATVLSNKDALRGWVGRALAFGDALPKKGQKAAPKAKGAGKDKQGSAGKG